MDERDPAPVNRGQFRRSHHTGPTSWAGSWWTFTAGSLVFVLLLVAILLGPTWI